MEKEKTEQNQKNLTISLSYKKYGDKGRVILFFPDDEDSSEQLEQKGMIEQCRPFWKTGRCQIYAVSTLDKETFDDLERPFTERVALYENYVQTLKEQILEPLKKQTPTNLPLTAGCGRGAFHAMNLFCRFPDMTGGALCVSGFYQLDLLLGHNMNETAKENSPLLFMNHEWAEKYENDFIKSRIIISSGKSDEAQTSFFQTLEMEKLFISLKIPFFIDIWGKDVTSDWYWWNKQIPYFMEKILS
jgi:esterase/lipase superfamily enzyme